MAGPNWKYVAIGVVRRQMPRRVLFALMALQGRGNSAEEDPDKAFGLLSERMARAGVLVRNGHVVELGSGRYARLGLRMIAAGARRVTLVDLYAIPLGERRHRAMLERDCAALGMDATDALSRLEVVQGDFTRLDHPALGAADVVLSNAVLEHVRDPAAVLTQSYRWLRPGGWTYHVIDLRDHNLGFQQPFEMLAYSDEVWQRWLDLGSGFHLNRWRAPDYLRAIEEAGFERVGYNVRREDRAGLVAVRARLHPSFRHIDDQMLAILGMDLSGRKPAASAHIDARLGPRG
jgi:SAM-dependent methyltransferase